jgi:hypothetical protein
VWAGTVDAATFDRLRKTYQISQAIRHGDEVEIRLIAAAQPHAGAVQVEPSLEEAYLYLTGPAPAGDPSATATNR